MDESVQKHLEQPVKTDKLSHWLRTGVALIPASRQGRRVFFERDDQRCGACALGTAYYAATGKKDEFVGMMPWLKKMAPNLILCSASDKFEDGMSREAVADWLEAQGY